MGGKTIIKSRIVSALNTINLYWPAIKQKLGETNKVQPKTKMSVAYFEIMQIHPEITKVSKKLFEDGHYSQAIFEAFKLVNNAVKQKSKLNEDGKNLMLKVFSPNKPILKFNEMNNQSEKDEQEGFMHLYAGAIQGIRNPKGHENIQQNDQVRAIKYLIFASLLYERLGEAKTPSQ